MKTRIKLRLMRCPHCAEEIQDEAKKWRYCHELLAPTLIAAHHINAEKAVAAYDIKMGTGKLIVALLGVALLVIGIFIFGAPHILESAKTSTSSSWTAPPNHPQPIRPPLTSSTYARIKFGMSVDEVSALTKFDPEFHGERYLEGVTTKNYVWEDTDGTTITAVFSNDKLKSKATTLLQQ